MEISTQSPKLEAVNWSWLSHSFLPSYLCSISPSVPLIGPHECYLGSHSSPSCFYWIHGGPHNSQLGPGMASYMWSLHCQPLPTLYTSIWHQHSLLHQLRSCSGFENVCWLPGRYKLKSKLLYVTLGMWFDLLNFSFPSVRIGIWNNLSEVSLGFSGAKRVIVYNKCSMVLMSFPALSSKSEPNILLHLHLLSIFPPILFYPVIPIYSSSGSSNVSDTVKSPLLSLAELMTPGLWSQTSTPAFHILWLQTLYCHYFFTLSSFSIRPRAWIYASLDP